MSKESWKVANLAKGESFIFSQSAEKQARIDASHKCCKATNYYNPRLFIWEEENNSIIIKRVR